VIFEQIVLENFGPYGGRQSLMLAPPSPERPVVLVGALNGVGKTSLLDALQLAFYGNRATPSNRNGQSYDTYLRQCIHRGTEPVRQAAVEVRFRHVSAGEEHVYHVRRAWSLRSDGEGISERVRVERDGQEDQPLAETWDSQVDVFLPRRIAPLFFFDGEKIEGLADPASSAEILATAVQSLLGIDLVERLSTDLVVVARRNRGTPEEAGEQRKIQELKDALQETQTRYSVLQQERGALQNQIDRSQLRLTSVEETFRREGGELFEQRQQLDSEYTVLQAQLNEATDALHQIASGSAPLLLVRDMLERVSEQDRLELEAARAESVDEILSERDEQLLEQVRTLSQGDVPWLDSLARSLADDRTRRVAARSTELYIHLTKEGRELLSQVLRADFGSDGMASMRAALERAHVLKSQLENLERVLAQVPPEQTIAKLLDERHHVQEEHRTLVAKLAHLDDQMRSLSVDRQVKEQRLATHEERLVDLELERDGAARILTHARRVRKTLTQFRGAVVRHHLQRLETLVLNSYRQLLRKGEMVSGLSIDPETFRIHLFGPEGAEIAAERLSAGERQLLAVSLLWGLAQASGRTLPIIVDTPLGRLDSAHRAHLIERYFPHAGPQVVVLSTDEEIDEELYRRLKPRIGTEYLLHFDEHRRSTEVKPGYFWSV
jgi:DNA sulfur modification protein DndD